MATKCRSSGKVFFVFYNMATTQPLLFCCFGHHHAVTNLKLIVKWHRVAYSMPKQWLKCIKKIKPNSEILRFHYLVTNKKRLLFSISAEALVASAQPVLPTPWGALCLFHHGTDCCARNKMCLENKSIIYLVHFAPLLKVRISLSPQNHSFSAFRAAPEWRTCLERSPNAPFLVLCLSVWHLWEDSASSQWPSRVCEHGMIFFFFFP